ncbi:hypothetical protein N7517_008324 [Penicillium concentricum]|uniref:NWD NACHT-NTPase N-terminal domain-containing protein n=1 Tax=Penicillium concentricum TaxID=293559 RepID=A0A9W9V1K9_9EURO|nr:uncharacterized protein N7517_008324 [Penicillium concentricum]KAJ5365438.1 hypothetical protein N7517_008324 [Penicillium concentricum]
MGLFSATKDRLLRKHRKNADKRAVGDEVSLSPAPETTDPDTPPLDRTTSIDVADTQAKPADSSISNSTPNLPPFSSVSDKPTLTDAPLVETQKNGETRYEVWSRSFAMFQERDTGQELVTAYTNYLASLQGEDTPTSIDFSNPESVEDVVKMLLADREQKQWKFHIRSHNISVREQVEKLGKFLLWSDPLVKTAVSTQPLAALAWSGVSLILPLIMSSATEKGNMANGLEGIGELQMFWQIFETEYLESDRRQHYENLIQPLAKLYSYVIEYQARVIFHLTSPQHSRVWQDVQGSNAWTGMVEKIDKSDESCRNLLQITTKSKIQENSDQQLQEIQKLRTTQEKTLQCIEQGQKDDKEEKLLHALAKAADSYEENMSRNLIRVPGTCEWILEDEGFNGWRDSSSGVLWVAAGPGRGKSVLSRSLIDENHLDASTITLTSAGVLTSATSVVAHFFFKEGAGGKMDGTQALCAILRQLFWSPSTQESTRLIRHGLPGYKANGDSLVPKFPELWRILVACAADPEVGEITCVMDALDECEKRSAHQIIDTLEEFYSTDQTLARSKLKFFITSRPLQNLQDRFDGLSNNATYLRLDSESKSEQIQHEIDLVIDEKVEDITKGFTESDREKIKLRLKNMQNRTYLWLHLIFNIIHNDRLEYSRYSDLETLLDDLPEEVSQVYERMLSGSKDKSRLKTLLEFVLVAQQPLTLDEANIALTLAIQDQKGQAVTSHEDLMAKRWPSDQFQGYIMNLCGLFISVHEEKLSFIHQTAREFLTTSKKAKEEGYWKGVFDLPHSHGTTSRQCLQYLLLPDVSWRTEWDAYSEDHLSEGIRNRKYPFLSYSARYWNLHFIEQEASLAEQYTEDARVLCDVKKHHLSTWAPIFDYSEFHDVSVLTDLLVACYLGITQVIQVLLDEGFDVNIQDQWSLTALQAASLRGFQQVVQILLDNGADLYSQFGRYGISLQAASFGGHEKIVEILLNQGANVNIESSDFKKALQLASYEGHERVVKILLKWGAKVNMQGADFYTALYDASLEGHERVVEILLNHGANVNMEGGYYDTPLQVASFKGHERIIEILLNHGANINLQGGHYHTALIAASVNGHERIVEVLLNQGANVNLQGEVYGTALQAVLAMGHGRIAETLLEWGADVNPQYGSSHTPLQDASLAGLERVVEILLSQGVNVNIQSGYCHTALQAASMGGYERIVEVLLNQEQTSTYKVETTIQHYKQHQSKALRK